MTSAPAPPQELREERVSDTTLLLQMLQGELDGAKARERANCEDAEKFDRDGRRTVVMLSLAQEQLELHKQRNTSLRAQVEQEQQTVTELRAGLEAVRRELASTRDDGIAAAKKSEAALSKFETAFAQRSAEAEQAQGSLERVRRELQEQRVAFAKHVEEAEENRRAAFEKTTTLTVRLQSVETDLAELEELRKRETKEATAREYELSQSVHALKRENRDVRDQLERENRSAFELQALLKKENEQLKLKLAQMEGMIKTSDRENFAKIQQLTHEAAQLQERLEEAVAAAAAREKALEQQVAKLCTNLRVAQEEVNELAAKEAAGAKHHIDTIVQLSATRDGLRARVASLEDEVAATKEKSRAAEVAFAQERTENRRQLQHHAQTHSTTLATKEDELVKIRDELTATTHRMVALEAELEASRKGADKNERVRAAEIASLRAEVEGYKNAVALLERDRAENMAVLTLREQNESLQAQCTSLRNQVASANRALADLRIEADISESYRLKTMQEHVEAQLQRVAALEKERRCARPLLQDLIELVQRKEIGDAALARDIDVFFRRFGNSADAPPPALPLLEQ